MKFIVQKGHRRVEMHFRFWKNNNFVTKKDEIRATTHQLQQEQSLAFVFVVLLLAVAAAADDGDVAAADVVVHPYSGHHPGGSLQQTMEPSGERERESHDIYDNKSYCQAITRVLIVFSVVGRMLVMVIFAIVVIC